MDRCKQYTTFRKSFEAEILLYETLKQVDVVKGHFRFKCPCGGRDHYATSEMTSDVLHCYFTGRQWLVDINPARNILAEEREYFVLMDKHQSHLGKLYSPSEAFRLWSEQGVPWEMLESTDERKLAELVESHRQTSKAKKPLSVLFSA